MNTQEVMINCCYAHDGTAVQDILKSSFAAFLKRKIENFAPGASGHV